ncbi:unnamed protein product [Spirodela intermedia]|uniref:Uncharacterized protein n=1 Tax=Spirodela intermedia TaxID=51605 RepID=A0A7I8LNU7_SPIIN|nr:unnamed protein product [Spirodela intermedia]
MISGARYSWVPTNDMDRAPVGSATSSGRAAAAPPPLPLSVRGFRVFLPLPFWEKSLGMKQTGWMQAEEGSMHAVCHGALEQRWRDRASQREIEIGEHYVAVLPDEDVLRLQVPVDDPQHVETGPSEPYFQWRLSSRTLAYHMPNQCLHNSMRSYVFFPFSLLMMEGSIKCGSYKLETLQSTGRWHRNSFKPTEESS